MSLLTSCSSFRKLAVGVALASLATSFVWTTDSLAVGTRHFVIESGSDFKKGELEGVAVDSGGFLRPGWDLGAIEVAGAESVWSVLEHEGSLLLGTGNEGKIYQIKAGKAEELVKTDGMAVTSLVHAFGRVLVSEMPGGKIYELSGKKLSVFTELEDEAHIWDMAYDEKAKALYVATGPEGKLYRITSDGTAQVYFDAPQDHLVSVATGRGRVFAGSSEKARLYEITGPGRSIVLHDFAATEVRDIQVGKGGSVYVIVNELSGGPRSDSMDKTKLRGPSKKSAKKGSGKAYRFFPNGQIEELYSASKEFFVSLSLDKNERPIVGTGVEGRLIRLEADHQNSVLADVEERQVSAILRPGKGGWVITSDPVVAHKIEAIGGEKSLWTSAVLDAGLRARFGRLSWDADGKVEFSTRSGNTEEPDETWKDWSRPMKKFGRVASPAGRYLQLRARLVGKKGARVRRIDVPFVTDNLRPLVTKVKAKSTAEIEGSEGIASSGGPFETKASSTIKLSWDVENPDEDSLRYRVEYQLVDQEGWFDALKPGKVLIKKSVDWETEDLPEGHYRIRVIATDELSNPPARVKKHTRKSEVILVDNTAPRFERLVLKGFKLSGVARDGIGPIARLELRVQGRSEWIPLEPKDGIFDQAREKFEIDLSKISIPQGALLTLRVFDTAGNYELRHLRYPKES